MTEKLLQFIWANYLFNNLNLRTNNNQSIIIFKTGELNTNQGPDFSNAHICIDNVDWYGNIELHIKKNDWNNHKHYKDINYKNVILHVVWEDDNSESKTIDNFDIPVLEIKQHVNDKILYHYNYLMNKPYKLACSYFINSIPKEKIDQYLYELFIDRLTEKNIKIQEDYIKTGNNIEETMYRTIVRYFGFSLNTEHFELLSKDVSYLLLQKHQDSLFQIEAILFGCAGLLELDYIEDEYFLKLKAEYLFLKNKYTLTTQDQNKWQFLRTRPLNFPTIRIAQLAKFIQKNTMLFSVCLETTSVDQFRKLFDFNISDYWENHYIFGKQSDKISKCIGKQSVDTLIINSILPVLFFYAEVNNNNDLKNRVVSFYKEIKPEKNSIINNFEKSGIKAKNAAQSQALIYLDKYLCSKKQHLQCFIGQDIITKKT